MPIEQPARLRSSSARVRLGRDALLNPAAAAMLQPVRELICEPNRAQIARVLSTGSLSVGDLALILGRSKSATSQHLRVLREAGIVSAHRSGRSVIYTLSRQPMVDMTMQLLDRAASVAAD